MISAELVDVIDNSLLWGEQYERKLSDMLAVEKEIAREISENLRLKLSREEARRLNSHQTENTEAYNLYLQGRYHIERMTSYSLRKGAALFERAIEIDPDYTLAYIGLTSAWILGCDWVFPPQDVMPRTRTAAIKLLRTDDSLASAHAALAYVKAFYDWNWTEAEIEYRRAIELNPNQAPIEYARFLAAMGRFDEAIAESRRAEQLDPVSPRIKTWVGRILFAARQYEEAERQFRASSELDPHHVCAPILISDPLIVQAKYEEAIASIQKFITMDRSMDNISYLGFAHAKAGNREEALKALDEIHQMSTQEYVSPYYIALVHIGLGNTEEAFIWLEKALEDRVSMMVELRTDPKFDIIRSDPRYMNLLAKVGLI
jgi:tetratricopeptide (TPR) repeat protein